MVEHSDSPIKSIELQLVRVETCGCAEGYAKDGTLQKYCHVHVFYLHTVIPNRSAERLNCIAVIFLKW